MELKRVEENQIDVAYGLIEQAKAFLKSCGVDQWQKGYPSRDSIVSDVADKTGWFLEDGGEILGYACIDFGGEAAYDTLRGSWLDAAPYAVIHRMAVSDSCKGKGVAHAFFQAIDDYVKQQGITSIRVDTDEDNAIMKHLIEALGYTYCGTIWFDNSTKIAYQKQLK